jgi:uncharacterized protein YciI
MSEERRRYAVWATDRDGALQERLRVREAHRLRLRDPSPHRVTVLLAGPTLDRVGGFMNGTMLVVEAESVEAVQAFIADDPYIIHDVYAAVDIRLWRCGLGALAEPGAGGASSTAA